MPKEINSHKNEYNEDYGIKKIEMKKEKKKETEEAKAKTLRRKLLSYLTGAAVAVSVVTSSTGFDMFGLGNTERSKEYVYQFECHNAAYAEKRDDDELGVLVSGDLQTSGSVWSEEFFEIGEGLTVSFDYCIAGGYYDRSFEAAAGDGLAVNFSETAPDFSMMHNGGELGYIGDYGVEIDYVFNPYGEIRETQDYASEHIAIIDSGMNHLDGTENIALGGLSWHHIDIELASSQNNKTALKVYLNETLIAKTDIELNSDSLMIGLSAANGDGYGWAFISDLRINGGLVSISSEESEEQLYIEKLTEKECLPPSMGGGIREYGAYGVLKHIPYEMKPAASNDKQSNISASPENGANSVMPSPTKDSTSSISSSQEEGGAEDVAPVLVSCDNCNGTGIICPGSVAADDPEGCHGEVYVHCKACNETGKESDGSPCNWCKGTLTHLCPSFENHRTCEYCNGKGYYYLEE